MQSVYQQPAGGLYGATQPATPTLGIYEATPARVLLLSRANKARPAQQPAGALYGTPRPATPMLGIYQATPARVLLVSRVVPVRAAGVPEVVIPSPAGPITVTQAPPQSALASAGSVAWGVLATASMAASAYHGVKRNKGSLGYGFLWGALGAMFPVITPVVAAAQGFAKPA